MSSIIIFVPFLQKPNACARARAHAFAAYACCWHWCGDARPTPTPPTDSHTHTHTHMHNRRRPCPPPHTHTHTHTQGHRVCHSKRISNPRGTWFCMTLTLCSSIPQREMSKAVSAEFTRRPLARRSMLSPSCGPPPVMYTLP